MFSSPRHRGATVYTHLGNEAQTLDLPPLIPPCKGGKYPVLPLCKGELEGVKRTCVYTVALLGRGAGGEGKTFSPSGFSVKLTPMSNAVPLQRGFTDRQRPINKGLKRPIFREYIP